MEISGTLPFVIRKGLVKSKTKSFSQLLFPIFEAIHIGARSDLQYSDKQPQQDRHQS